MNNTTLRFLIAAGTGLCSGFMPDAAQARDDRSEIEVRGTISALSSGSVTVSSITFAINSSTEFEDLVGRHVPASTFAVGNFVKVEGSPVNGNLVAREIELENDSSSSNPGGGSSGGSNGGSNGGSSSGLPRKMNLKGRFIDAPNVVTNAFGSVERKVEREKKKVKDEFKVTVHIPIPSTVPPLPSESGAAALELTANLSRAGVPFASCSLSLDHMEQSARFGLVAEYKADYRLETKKGSTRERAKKGACDIDLATAGIQLGLPDLQANDTVEVLNAGAPFLAATAKSKR